MENLGLVVGAKVRITRGKKYPKGTIGTLISFAKENKYGQRVRIKFDGATDSVLVALENVSGYINHTPKVGELVLHTGCRCYCKVLGKTSIGIYRVTSVCPNRCWHGLVKLDQITQVVKA